MHRGDIPHPNNRQAEYLAWHSHKSQERDEESG